MCPGYEGGLEKTLVWEMEPWVSIPREVQAPGGLDLLYCKVTW